MSRGIGLGTGMFRDNPVFALFLGLCPAVAVSRRVSDALVLSLVVLCVMQSSALLIQPLRIALSRSRAGARTRALLSVLVVGGCVTVFDLLVADWLPESRTALGIYLPVVAANCLLFGRTAVFSWNARVLKALADALGLAIGFAVALVLMAAAREALGEGTITLFPIGSFNGRIDLTLLSGSPVRVVTLPAGGLLVLGYLAGLKRIVFDRSKGERP
jgi:electron transport complex protein RnfE